MKYTVRKNEDGSWGVCGNCYMIMSFDREDTAKELADALNEDLYYTELTREEIALAVLKAAFTGRDILNPFSVEQEQILRSFQIADAFIAYRDKD